MTTDWAGDPLRLEVTEFTDARNWRWVLKDAGGAFLGDHVVAIDPSAVEYEALENLDEYLYRYSAADHWFDDETRLMREIGEWIERELLGDIAAAIVEYGTPTVVRVVVPPQADQLLYLPLEAAYAKGRPITQRDVSLVHEVDEEAPAVRLRPVQGKLRLLAVFSLPTSASPLALRRERHAC